MARITILQRFSSCKELAQQYRVVLPKPWQDWRLIASPVVGQIHALPNMRGVAVATNGIICAIIKGDETLTFGHIDNFVPDVQSQVEFKTACQNKPVAAKKPIVDISEFV